MLRIETIDNTSTHDIAFRVSGGDINSMWRPMRIAANDAAHMTDDCFIAEVLLTYV